MDRIGLFGKVVLGTLVSAALLFAAGADADVPSVFAISGAGSEGFCEIRPCADRSTLAIQALQGEGGAAIYQRPLTQSPVSIELTCLSFSKIAGAPEYGVPIPGRSGSYLFNAAGTSADGTVYYISVRDGGVRGDAFKVSTVPSTEVCGAPPVSFYPDATGDFIMAHTGDLPPTE